MNIYDFFKKLVQELNLGTIIDGPTQINGGLTHRMFKVFTNKGHYIIKLLNPNIMRRPTALENFTKTDLYEEILKQNNIKAVYSLNYNNKKMQKIDEQYFYIYEWYDGKTLNDSEIKEYHCEEIAKTLAKIHNIDLIESKYNDDEKNIDFKYYIELAKEKDSIIYNYICDKLDILNISMLKGNESISKLPNFFALCHNDMDPKNVMWLEKDYKLIDLECLGYSNPYLELYELALYWSGYNKCEIDLNLFKIFFKSYFSNTKLKKDIDWESVYYANNGRLSWLEFNIKRALMIDCDTTEEQEIGINEVKETIKHVVYYDKIKNQLLNVIQEVINE